MPRTDPLQTAMNAGELSPRLHARTDFNKYPAGLEEALNLICLPEGGVTRRPATRYVAAVKDSSIAGRLMPFEATATSHFVLEFSDGEIRFFFQQGQLTVADTTAAVTNGTFPSGISDWDDRSTGGAGNQISYDATNDRLTLETSGTAADDIGWAEQDITTGSTGTEHVIKFRVIGDRGDKIEFQVGTTSTGAETLGPVEKETGFHCVAFTPSTSPFYIQFRNLGSNADKDIQIDDISIIDDAPVEIDSPYLEADLFNIMGTQSNDVRYLFLDGLEPYKLLRFGNTTWSLVEVAWSDGPFLDENSTATTMTPGATSGVAVTVTASSIVGINDGDGFKSTDVGRPIRIKNTAVWGWGIIVTFTNTKNVDVHVKKAFSTTNATAEWKLGSWSDTTGWPKTGGFFEQRLYTASSTKEPQTLWATQTADFENFTEDDFTGTVEADDALNFTLSADSVNEIHWLSSGDDTLAIGTSGGEWIPSASGIVITPLDITIRRQTTMGTALVQPLRINHVVLFVQKAKRKIREFVFNIEFDGFISPDMTRLSSHITSSGIKEMTFQQEPDNLVWCLRGDGIVPTMTFRREEDVVGWARQQIGGVLNSAFGQVWQVDDSGPTFVDETTDANDDGNADWTVFPATEAVGDYVALGFKERFRQLTFDYANGTAGVAGVVTWEYWNGTEWFALVNVVDGTAGFTTAAADDLNVTWDMPDNWKVRTLNSVDKLYYVRARITTVYTTNPVLDQGFVGGPTKVTSITSIVGAEVAGQVQDSDDRNEVWMIVERTINNLQKRYVEVLEGYFDHDIHDQEDAYYADSIITYDGASTTSLTGLGHMEGEKVKIWGDGAIIPDEIVVSGAITLDSAVSVAQVGLPYKHRGKTLRITGGSESGTVIGKKKRNYEITFVLLDSYVFKYGPEDSKLIEKDFRVVADAAGSGAPLFTGEETMRIEGGWEEDSRIIFESDEPAPFTLLAIAPNVSINPLK